MKRIAAICLGIAMIATACHVLPDGEDQRLQKGGLVLRIADFYVDAPALKSAALPDTNSFVLTVADLEGKVYYQGLYGERPESIMLSEGTYEVSLVSADYSVPAFESPQWGSEVLVDIIANETTRVLMECSQINAGIRLNYGNRYREMFGTSPVRIVQGENSLLYTVGEDRYAYFPPGEALFEIVTDTETKPIFKRTLRSGVNLTINLDASSDSGESIFEVTVDTQAIYETEDILTDGTFFQEDGLTPRTAFCVDSAARHVGDTVWVWGYIVGGDCTASNVNFFSEDISSATHFAIAASLSASKRSECMAVELSKAAMRTELNLVDNPQLKYRKIYLRGKVTNYMGSWPGIKNLSEYRF
ncbi:MAG: DUF4493 domain-containing protein [Bacteroidales bacterium]|nr:DUF4493 domain-containing protein [Bacteroidales bacterium]